MSPEEMPVPRAIATRLPATMSAADGRDGGARYLAAAMPFLDRDGMVSGVLQFWYLEKA
jgi:hypothetical protein